MAKRKSSKVNPKYKTKYRVVNWAEYDRALRNRGSLTVWFSPDAIEQWTPQKDGRRGRPRKYSDSAIVTALTLRLIFHLALRQTEGFIASLLELMNLDLEAPDHTVLSRRGKDVDLPDLVVTPTLVCI